MGDTLKIPKADDYLSLNDRIHHMRRHALEQSWQQAAYIVACATLGRTPADRARPPATVTVTLPFKKGGRRDPHNYVATVKPIIDGLVKAGVWPDDTPEFVTVAEPAFRVGRDFTDVLVHLAYREPR